MLNPPGSNDTLLLRHKTQSNVPPSSYTALSKLVGSLTPFGVGAADSCPGRRFGGG